MLKTVCQKSLDGLILRILNGLYCQKPIVLQFRTTNMNNQNYKHGRCNKLQFYDALVFPEASFLFYSKVSTSLHKEFTLLGHRISRRTETQHKSRVRVWLDQRTPADGCCNYNILTFFLTISRALAVTETGVTLKTISVISVRQYGHFMHYITYKVSLTAPLTCLSTNCYNFYGFYC